MERILPLAGNPHARTGRGASLNLARELTDDGTVSLVGIALVGVLAAFSGLAFFAAGGDWSGGLSVAGFVLLATGIGLVFVLRQRTLAAERRLAERTVETVVSALPLPALLFDRTGRLRAANRAFREEFDIDPPPDAAACALEIRARDGGRHRSRMAPFAHGTLLAYAPVLAEEDRDDALGDAGFWHAMGESLAALDTGCVQVTEDQRLEDANSWLAGRFSLGEDAAAELAAQLLDPARDRLALPGGPQLSKQRVALAPGRWLVLLREIPAAGDGAASTTTRQWQSLFDTAPLGLAIVDREGKLVAFNKPFRRFAPNRNPRQGDSLIDYVAGEDGAGIVRRLAAIFAGEPPASPLDVSFNTHPARTGQIAFSLLPGDRPEHALVHLIDTTKHKSLERQFVQAQKMQAVGQLAGGVAHDFNNLLTAIIGFCDLLLVRHGPGDQSFSDVMQIKQNANRAANLVRQLLAFSRQQTMRPKVLVITDVLADLANLLRRLIGERIELKMIHGRDIGPVKVDQGQLEQVIINLAVNARDAMPEGGVLTIRTKAVGPEDRLVQHYSVMPAGNYVLIEVADTGEGIPAENLNKIFEPFFTTKSVGQGTGLGLSTVYGIIKQTGGFIFVESAPGEGATFRVYLPLHGEAAEDRTPIESSPATDLTGRGTILLVEDEEAVRLFASRALANKGYRVLQAASGEDALQIVRSHEARIDLLISDVVMPNMDGPTLVAEAKRLRPELRVIFISGYAEDVFKSGGGKSTEGFAFLPKPFSLKQLAESVKNALD